MICKEKKTKLSRLQRDTAYNLCLLNNRLSIYLSYEHQLVKSVRDFEEVLKDVLSDC